MQVTIQANGSRDEVRTAVANGIREARAGNEQGWPALRAIRDGLAMALDEAGPNDQVGVDVSISVVRVSRVDGQPIQRGADGLVQGEPLNLSDAERAALPALGTPVPGENVAGISRPVVERRAAAKRGDR
jgi:hypothetical protein